MAEEDDGAGDLIAKAVATVALMGFAFVFCDCDAVCVSHCGIGCVGWLTVRLG